MSDDDGVTGPLGISPTSFGLLCGGLLLLFVGYLVLPRGLRVQYFEAYPKRHAWSSRTRKVRDRIRSGGGSLAGSMASYVDARSVGVSTLGGGTDGPGSSTAGGTSGSGGLVNQNHRHLAYGGSGDRLPRPPSAGRRPPAFDASRAGNGTVGSADLIDLNPNEEIVLSAAMQQLRDPGALVVAHGSKGRPKTVRLRLVESAISWRTETHRKKPSSTGETGPKLGKLHHVPLTHILYVDVGKQTTALRRVENAAVAEDLCFSLLTKEGSLDLECNSATERDALVSSFSMVLDEVHANNWRDVQRAPSSDMPSSFDGGDRDEGL
jgi:hypothetical protein